MGQLNRGDTVLYHYLEETRAYREFPRAHDAPTRVGPQVDAQKIIERLTAENQALHLELANAKASIAKANTTIAKYARRQANREAAKQQRAADRLRRAQERQTAAETPADPNEPQNAA